LNSTITFWERNPINPIRDFAGEFRIIMMDQRNADRSSGPLDLVDPWKMYADDQMAVLDHLGIDRALMAGCCIGSSFIFELLKLYPERVVAGVCMQPIGHDETNMGRFGPDMWTPWGENLVQNGAPFSMNDVNAFGHALFDSGFVFSVDREFLKTVTTPLMLLYGNDPAHPRGVSLEVASLLPHAQKIETWKAPDTVSPAVEQMRAFLNAHAK
jgi:pimeloyl-ACP methyl ester carboxylesterase